MNEAPHSLNLGTHLQEPTAHAELHQIATRASHKLNNLLTALRCQWDLLAAKTDLEAADAKTFRQIGTMIDETAEWTRTLSIACAEHAPISEMPRGWTAGASNTDCLE